MSWFSNLFKWPEDHPASSEFPLQECLLQPISKEEGLEVSEPVFSFVSTFKSNPKRFKVKRIPLNKFLKYMDEPPYGPRLTSFKITDNYEKLSWEFTMQNNWYIGERKPDYEIYQCPLVITKEEANYILKEMLPYFSSLESKLNSLQLLRYRRPLRNELMQIYCKHT